MPIAKYTPDAPTKLKPNIPKIVQQENKGIVVDTKYTPLSSLITFVNGASWTVDYFSQVFDKDNDLRGQDSSQSAIYQQYTLIKGMELKVTNPLNQSQEPDSKRMVVTGSATLYPFIIPNEGDMFAADVGDGREGVFRIKTSEQKSFLKQATYAIEYELVYYSDAEPGRRTDLGAKAIRTLYYLKDFLMYGQNPLLIEDDFNAVQELEGSFYDIAKSYFTLFFNKEYSTLTIPGQPLPVYDHYVVEALLSILSTRDADQIKYIKKLNVDGDIYLKQPQLWSALIARDFGYITSGNAQMGLVDTQAFSHDPYLESISYTGISCIVYPSFPDTSNNALNTPINKVVLDYGLIDTTTRVGNLDSLVTTSTTETGSPINDIHPVSKTGYYVLSEAFYRDLPGQSKLELMVDAYFSKQAINPVELLNLVKNYPSWGGLEKFYYLPILLILIRSVIRNT